jgi:tetratricopeptide (TPR) repeat protein
LRAYTDTPLKLGNPVNLTNFISHITGTRVMPEVVKSWGTSFQLLSWQAWSYWANLVEQISILHIIFGLAGLIFLLKKDFKIALLMLWVFLINIIFFRDWDLAFGFLPSFLIYTIWAGVGFLIALNFIVSWGSEMNRPWAKRCLTFFLVGVLVISLSLNFGSNFKKNNLSDFYTAHTMGENILDSLKPNSAIITRYSIPHFLLWHLKYVEARRPDLLLVSQMEFTSDEILKRFIWSRKDYSNIYWTGNEKTALFSERLTPNGLVFRFDFNPSKDFISAEDFRHHMKYRRRFEEDLLNDPYVEEEETYPQLYAISSELYYYYSLRDVRAEAEEEFKTLVSINKDSTISNLFYGIMLADKGEIADAVQVLSRVYHMTPAIQRGTLFSYQYKPVVFALGLYCLEHKDYSNAIKLLNYVIESDPFILEARYSLALALEGAGRYREALREYEHCLLLKPDNRNARQRMNHINRLLGEKSQ